VFTLVVPLGLPSVVSVLVLITEHRNVGYI